MPLTARGPAERHYVAWAERAASSWKSLSCNQGTMMIRFLLSDSRTDSPHEHAHVRLTCARFSLLSLALVALASLAACGSTATNTSTRPAATNTPSFANVAPGTVLYQSDWSKGL